MLKQKAKEKIREYLINDFSIDEDELSELLDFVNGIIDAIDEAPQPKFKVGDRVLIHNQLLLVIDNLQAYDLNGLSRTITKVYPVFEYGLSDCEDFCRFPEEGLDELEDRLKELTEEKS